MPRLCTRGGLRTSASSHYVYRRATLNCNLPRRIGDRRFPYFSHPSPGTSSPPDMTLPIAWPELDLDCIETLGEEELDEVREIQGATLPIQSLRVSGITISHELKPAALAGGDYLDHFWLSRHDWHVRRRRFRQGLAGGHVCGAGASNTQGHAQNRTASDPGNGSLNKRDCCSEGYPPDIPLSSPARPDHSAVASFARRNARAYVAVGRRMSRSEGCGNPSRSSSRNQLRPPNLASGTPGIVLHGWFDRRTQYPTSRIRGRGTAARLRKPCRKIHAGIAGPTSYRPCRNLWAIAGNLTI
jgi:hypothetical protein